MINNKYQVWVKYHVLIKYHVWVKYQVWIKYQVCVKYQVWVWIQLIKFYKFKNKSKLILKILIYRSKHKKVLIVIQKQKKKLFKNNPFQIMTLNRKKLLILII